MHERETCPDVKKLKTKRRREIQLTITHLYLKVLYYDLIIPRYQGIKNQLIVPGKGMKMKMKYEK